MSVAVLDGETNQIITTLTLGPEDPSEGGQGIAVDSALNRVYVSRYQAGTVVIIADAQAPTVTLVVQIDGKVRDRLEIDAALGEKQILQAALGSDRVREWLVHREVARTVVVPGRLVNIVTKGEA